MLADLDGYLEPPVEDEHSRKHREHMEKSKKGMMKSALIWETRALPKDAFAAVLIATSISSVL